MKLAIGSVTWFGVHSPEMLMRHNLDWRLQTDQRYHLYFLHDGPVEGREDRVSVEDIDYGANTSFITYPERRKYWGAYCRKEWLAALDPVDHPFTLFCCGDDQITPYLVETIFREMDDNTDIVMWNINHHHYNYRSIPGGTWPTLSRCDWVSGAIRTEIAQKTGINYPEEFAADGFYWQDCFSQINQDTGRLKILDNFLVVKN